MSPENKSEIESNSNSVRPRTRPSITAHKFCALEIAGDTKAHPGSNSGFDIVGKKSALGRSLLVRENIGWLDLICFYLSFAYPTHAQVLALLLSYTAGAGLQV